MARIRNSIASAFFPRLGAKPPSSPTAVTRPFSWRSFFSVWNTSEPMRSARDRLGDSLAQVSFRVAVPELQRLAGAGGSAGRDCRAADGAAPERHLDLERGRAPGVQDLACVYGFDLGHGRDRTLGSGPLAVKGKALTDGG